MGVDNLLDLPFWQDVAKYPTSCDRIYILDRDISEEIKQKKVCESSKTFEDGSNISNLQTSNLKGIVTIKNGGTGLYFIQKGALLYGDLSSKLNYNTNLIYWDNDNSNLIVNSTITTNGRLINNLVSSNLTGIVNVDNGGTGTNVFNDGCLLFGSNNNPIASDSNIIWNKQTSNLIVNGSIIANQFYGHGFNISNIVDSNIIGVLKGKQGGTGLNIVQQTAIIYGGVENNLAFETGLLWDPVLKILNVGTYNNIKTGNMIKKI